MKYIFCILIFAANAFAQVDGNPANWCRNGLFSQESDFKIAKIKGTKNEKAYFYKDEDDCPSEKNCLQKSYLIAGDEVITSRNFGKYTCSWFQPKTGFETVGWILTEKLEFVETNSKPKLNDWIGTWKFYDNSINIGISIKRGHVGISGNAIWKGLGDNIHSGELDSTSEPSGSVLKIGEETGKFACKVTMRLIGKFLIVSDNLNCGGANVTFNGIYQNKRKPLNQVKRIFILPLALELGNKRSEFNKLLKTELLKNGFIVEEENENADAAISVDLSVEITLDGGKDDLSKLFYHCQLNLPTGEIIWNAEVKFITKGSDAENDKFATQKIAERLYNDWNRVRMKNKN